MRTPTASQQKLLKLLADNSHDPLSYRDIAENIGFKSPNTVAYHARRGFDLAYSLMLTQLNNQRGSKRKLSQMYGTALRELRVLTEASEG